MTPPVTTDAAKAPGYQLLQGASGVELPETGILSRTLIAVAGTRITWFGFAAGEELTEHTSTRPALLHFLRGRARLTLGSDTIEVRAGDYLRMDAGLPHGVVALDALEFVLTLLPADAPG